ncbi:TPA: hypothetical protein ACSTPU_000443 [Staphylococcus aureus]
MIIMRGYNERYCSWTNTAIQCDYFNKVRQVKKDSKSDRLSNNINSNIIYRVLEKCITLYNVCSRYKRALILSEYSKKNIFNIKKAV